MDPADEIKESRIATLKLAVLIDADNVSYTAIKDILVEMAKYGNPTFKRIYGDWTKPHLNGWKEVLLDHAITPIQQYAYTTGKNATDSAMIIDAMDILYTAKVDGFCLVASDSDYTKLATRLREAGMKVFGVGEKKTPEPFVRACDKFIYIEILGKDSQPKSERPKESKTKLDAATISLVLRAVNNLADDSGWVHLGNLGNLILRWKPDFDPRNYDSKNMSAFVRRIDALEIDEQKKGKTAVIYVRIKPK